MSKFRPFRALSSWALSPLGPHRLGLKSHILFLEAEITEKRRSGENFDTKVLEKVEMPPLEQNGPILLNTINEKEIKDILEDKELKENIIKMILQNKWPISDINSNEKFAIFLEMIQRDIDSNLSQELSKIDITERDSDISHLLYKKMTDYMLEIVKKLYENQLNKKYSSMLSTSKFEYEVIIEKVKDDINFVR